MRRQTELPVLLAPGGGYDAAMAAIAAGADAIYLGGKQFSARAYAENFDAETLRKTLAQAHARGVKVYVTLNTLLWEREVWEAVEYASSLWEMGVDALICADVGLITLLRKYLPHLPIHASTQLFLHSAAGAKATQDLGCDTVVMARELSRGDLERAVQDAPQKIEAFVHGALCVSYSGQCLFSSLVGGRSGNRGECAQPCRLPYEGGYPLSLKDLSLAEHIPALIEGGVACLKIEGRMKSPAYVYNVTRIFRRLLDGRRGATPAEMEELKRIFSRDGLTDGYYRGKPWSGMLGVRREEDKASSRALEEPPALSPVALGAECRILEGVPATLTLTTPGGKQVCVEGDIPSPAMNAPLTEEGVSARLRRLGGTPYSLGEEDIRVELTPGLNLSPASLNALRRRAVEALDPPRTPVELPATPPTPPPLKAPTVGATALFCRGQAWEELTEEERGAFEVCFLPLWELEKLTHTPDGVWLPPVIFDREEPKIAELLESAKKRGVTWALCATPAQIELCLGMGMRVMGDFRLQISNPYTLAYWQARGVEECILSPELTLPRLRDLPGHIIAYGRIPLMLTQRCYVKGGCEGCAGPCESGASLKDRRGAEFPILRLPPHRNMILNSLPTYLFDKWEELPAHTAPHCLFTVEDTATCRSVISCIRERKPLPCTVRRLPK